MDDVRPVGLRKRSDIGRLAVLAMFYGRWMLRDLRVSALARSILGRVGRDASLRALRFEEALRARPLHRRVTTDAGIAATIRDLEVGAMPLRPDPHWGLDDAAAVAVFESACRAQQDRHGLQGPERAEHRDVHLRVARLWGPFVMDDPLHRALTEPLRSRSSGVRARVVGDLRRRLAGEAGKRSDG